jgi:hypothetical protein
VGVETGSPGKRTNDSESTIRINEKESYCLLVLSCSLVGAEGEGNGFAL